MTDKAILQEQFNKVVRHLLMQMEKSQNDADECLYRGPNGLMCAAGCMIPKGAYRKSMEHSSWTRVCKEYPYARKYLDIDLGMALQKVHDDYSPKGWRDCLERVADDFCLDMPEDV